MNSDGGDLNTMDTEVQDNKIADENRLGKTADTSSIYTSKDEIRNSANVSPTNSKNGNIIILGSIVPQEDMDSVIDRNKKESETKPDAKRKVLEETEFMEDRGDAYDSYTDDNNRIYRRYRLREVLKKPEIPTVNDVPEEDYLPKVKTSTITKCPHCIVKCESIPELRQHIRSNHKIIYTCSQCFQTFKTNMELVTHKKIHDAENHSYLCHKCKQAFSNHCDFLIHEQTHFKVKSLCQCPECGLTYNRGSFEMHIYTHFSIPMKCPVCSKELNGAVRLKAHMNNHSTNLKCVECEKVLNNKGEYNNHMAIHTGVKMHQCLYCGKGFRVSQQKKVHMRVHTKERPYSCTKCDRKFKQSTDLQRHFIKHDQNRKYQCDICKKRFRDKSDLPSHLRVHFKQYNCPECDKSYSGILGLKLHIMNKHSNEKPEKCEICERKFATKVDLRKHLMSKRHKNNVYKTTICKENDYIHS